MAESCTLEIKGHIIDSLTLSKVMDSIIELGAKCKVDEIKIGQEKTSVSYAKLKVEAENKTILDKVKEFAKKHGAVPV